MENIVPDDVLNYERSLPTPFANLTILPLLLSSLMTQQKNSPHTACSFNDKYDYVIVGAGSAGSVLANRLSELSSVSVLLLEAGSSPPLLSEVPATERFLFRTDVDWGFSTTPQKHMGDGLVNRQVYMASGKMLGGSSVLNDVIYSRGNSKDYDQWAANGATGWSYREVLPFFKKLEDNKNPQYVANGYHGVGGPMTVSNPPYEAEIKHPIFEAAQKLGYNIVDSNGPRQTGYFDHQGPLRNGQLCSTAKAYLVPAENRTNLDILSKAMVRKVLIKNRAAVGVEFDFKGQTHQVTATREVLISAGVFNTPKLLMLSGIGPRDELKKLGIPVVSDLPVGRNLQEHVGSNLNFLEDSSIENVALKLVDPNNIEEYINNRTGVLASTQLVSAVAFVKNGKMRPVMDYPDHEIYFLEADTLLPKLLFGLKPEVYKAVYGPYEGKAFVLCLVHMLHPKSRGTVTLNSTDPYDNPIIDPNYYDHPDDVKNVVKGLKSCKLLATSKTMKKVLSKPFSSLYPGCEQYQGNEDRYYECQVRSASVSFYHAVGTAKMGRVSDKSTVVDPKLRVKGVKRLRVVDASVMPTIPSGNTNFPTIMIAEKTASLIKDTLDC